MVALLVLPAVPVAALTPASTVAALGANGVALPSYVPAVLGLPFATRAGYDPSQSASVDSRPPATDTPVLVTVTLAPRDPSFFAPRGAGQPALTADQVRARYAPLPADYSALVSYFTGHGRCSRRDCSKNCAATGSRIARNSGCFPARAIANNRCQ
ncbi:MAG TPA: hypothetical protein VIZ68_07935, partial [Thermoplasmata archaeon]